MKLPCSEMVHYRGEVNLSEVNGQPQRLPDSLREPTTPIVVVSTLRSPDSVGSASQIIDELRTCMSILGELPGCISVELGRSMDSETDFVFISRWESVGSYRKALSNFRVKAEVIPFLSRYMVDSMTAELIEVAGSASGSFSSALATDAFTYERGNQ